VEFLKKRLPTIKKMTERGRGTQKKGKKKTLPRGGNKKRRGGDARGEIFAKGRLFGGIVKKRRGKGGNHPKKTKENWRGLR